MAIHFTPSTSSISDLTLHLKLAHQAGPEQTEIRTTFFPAEWHPQSGVQLTWPHAGTDWAPLLAEVDDCFVSIALEILAHDELLLIVTPEPDRIKALLCERIPSRFLSQVRYFECPTNDTWARDHAFLTLLTEAGPRLLDFQFNGWGNKFPAELDNAINQRLVSQSPSPRSPRGGEGRQVDARDNMNVIEDTALSDNTFDGNGKYTSGHGVLPPTGGDREGLLHGTYESHLDFVFEGGSIESDGKGTLLTTSECLLSPNRNPDLTRDQIEERLLRYFHADRVLWLDHGYLAGDDTDSHIDTLARFCPNNTIAYVQCTNPSDEHYDALRAMESQLRSFRALGKLVAEVEDAPSATVPTASASGFRLIPLPMPSPIYDPDDGHRLPATYANFLVINGAVLMPTYGQPENDEQARRQLQKAFPKYDIVPIDCRVLIRQHGSLHCSTMQYPIGVMTP